MRTLALATLPILVLACNPEPEKGDTGEQGLQGHGGVDREHGLGPCSLRKGRGKLMNRVQSLVDDLEAVSCLGQFDRLTHLGRGRPKTTRPG